MLKKDSELFFQIPDSLGRRVLHPCRVQEVRGSTYRLEFPEPPENLTADMDSLIYFERRREFMQQAVHVSTIVQPAPNLVIELDLSGEPVSAESRQYYRVSCMAASISATVGKETNCSVLDVSATGFAVYANEAYKVGDNLEVVLFYGGREYAGRAVVQSSRPVSRNRTRYGMQSLPGRDGRANDLHTSLNQINLAIQREQLQRLSGVRS
jgi:hypothetical protein